MYSVPLLREGLGANGNFGEGVIAAEHIPFVPAIGSNGEVVYCIPGSVPGGGIASGSNDFSSPLRAETISKELFQNGQLTQQHTNAVHPISASQANLTGLLQSIENAAQFTNSMIQSSQIQQYPKQLMFPTISFPFDSVDKNAQNEVNIKAMVQQSHASIPQVSSLLEGNSNLYAGAMNVAPNMIDFHQRHQEQRLSKLLKSEQQGFKVHGALNEFGPVEKAVFNQALSTQQKKITSSYKPETTPLSSYKGLSDLKQRSGKHSRRMFDQQSEKGGSTSVRSTCLNRTGVLREYSQVTSTCTESETVLTCRSSDVETRVRHVAKASSSPTIRYHPYAKPVQGCLKNQDKTKTGSAGNDGSSSSQTTEEPSEACRKTSSVRSVAVPKHGFYAADNSTTKLQSESDNVSRESTEALINFEEAKKLTEETKEKNKEEKPAEDNGRGEKMEESSSQSTESSTTTPESDPDSKESSRSSTEDSSCDGAVEESSNRNASSPSAAAREVHLPDPLPHYITKIDKPPSRVLKESLHCVTCDIYVNSDNQMKQHISSLRHRNTLQGIPTPPKPGREEKPKIKSDQYQCNVCKVTLNSDIQLSQHLSSQRHKNMLEGKPPKPRWSPYERSQQTLVHSASALRLPFKTLSHQSLLAVGQPSVTGVTSSIQSGIASLGGMTTAIPRGYITTGGGGLPGAAHLKQASMMLHDGGLLQAREIVYIGAPQVSALQANASFALPTALPGLLAGQQKLQLQPVVATQSPTVDWLANGSLRLTT